MSVSNTTTLCVSEVYLSTKIPALYMTAVYFAPVSEFYKIECIELHFQVIMFAMCMTALYLIAVHMTKYMNAL